MPSKIVNIIKDLFNGYVCAVSTKEGMNEWFQIETGVKQRCILSPLLFGIAIDFIMKKYCTGKVGIDWVHGTQLEDLGFADDITLIGDNVNSMREKTDTLSSLASKIGFEINKDRTKIMKPPINQEKNVYIEGTAFEEVNQFAYLTSYIDQDGDTRKEVRIQNAKAAMTF